MREARKAIRGQRCIRGFCGESEDEALDLEHCYYSWQPNPVTNDAHAVQSVLHSFRIAKPKMWKSQHSISM
ncbi:MAG: hypothetical protein ACLUTU_14995 [Blautia faecis]